MVDEKTEVSAGEEPPTAESSAVCVDRVRELEQIGEAFRAVALALAPLKDDAARARVVRAAGILLGFDIADPEWKSRG